MASARQGRVLEPVPSGPPPAGIAGSPLPRPTGPCPGEALWLALELPALPLEALLRAGGEERGIAVVDGGGSGALLLCCSAVALAAGVQPGMRRAAAQALCPSLVVLPREAETEARALSALAAWAGQFTSLVAIQPPAALLLEIGGSLRLFGGFENLLQPIEQGLSALGYDWRRGVAPTPLAAWLLARAGAATAVFERHALAAVLAPLPVACLPLPEPMLDTLRGMGVHRLGECLRLPRDGLSRRLGVTLLDLLDRALGRRPDPRAGYRPPARFERVIDLWDETTRSDRLLFAARRVLLELTGMLAALDAGVQGLELRLLHRRLPASRVRVGLLQPSRDVEHLLALLAERLELISLPAPVLQLELEADQLLPLAPRSLSLFAGDTEQAENAARVLERLRARLGRDAVHGVATFPAHAPERAWRVCEPGDRTASGSAAGRPLWLLPEPRPLVIEHDAPACGGRLRLLDGPERIESGWWEGGDVRRDYYVADNERGERLWIFRDLREPACWYLHGLFD